jgi:hypothetical protein
VLAQQGNQTAALESYRSAFTIANHLARLDPDNVGLQDDLAVSHHRIGEVPQAQGKLAAALESYRASVAIVERLVKAEPGNDRWQRKLPGKVINNVVLVPRRGLEPPRLLHR